MAADTSNGLQPLLRAAHLQENRRNPTPGRETRCARSIAGWTLEAAAVCQGCETASISVCRERHHGGESKLNSIWD